MNWPSLVAAAVHLYFTDLELGSSVINNIQCLDKPVSFRLRPDSCDPTSALLYIRSALRWDLGMVDAGGVCTVDEPHQSARGSIHMPSAERSLFYHKSGAQLAKRPRAIVWCLVCSENFSGCK